MDILFLVIVYRGMVIVMFAIALIVILMVQMLFVPLAQLSFQLMILLGKPLNHCGEGLHLPLQGVGQVSSLLVDGSH